MSTPTVYVLCDQNCKFEGMTKEQIIAAIAETTGATVTDVDTAFITKIKEQNGSNSMRFWVGTEAEYNTVVANGTKDANTIYCIKTNNDVVLNYGVGITSVEQTQTSNEAYGENVITVTLTNGVTVDFIVKNGGKPEKGTDYWTEEDKTEIVNDVLASLPNASGVSF